MGRLGIPIDRYRETPMLSDGFWRRAKSPMQSLKTGQISVFVAGAAICAGGLAVHPAFAALKAGHGNERVWEGWKGMKPASHPSHTLWKSLRDSQIPTASTTGYMSSHAPSS
jgi:hypothetical protein